MTAGDGQHGFAARIRMWLVRNEYTRLNVAAGQACCFV